MADQTDGFRRRFLARLAGDRDRLGWWTLPAFLVVGLAGAVLAGTFTVVWQTQKIQALEDEIADALAELRDGVAEVEAAGDRALADISAQVGDVQAAINAGLPVDSAWEIGVALLRVDVPAQSGSSRRRTLAAQEPSEGPSPTSSSAPSEPSGGAGGGEPVEQETFQPAPPPAAATARVGSAVAVAIDGSATFFATSYSLVADPSNPGGVLSDLSIDIGSGRVRAVVHSWDESRDLALLRADVGSVTLANWRGPDEPAVAGERTFLVGLTTTDATVQQPGSITFADAQTLLSDHDVVGTLRGGALIDAEGRLLGIGSADYRPLVDDDRPSNIPIRLLCERLLRACDNRPSDSVSESEG